MYKFTSAHSAGAWDSSQVTQVKICDEVININDQVDDLKIQLNGGTVINYTPDKNIDSTTGAIVNASNVSVSEKIPYTWTGTTKYYCGDNTQTIYGVAFYDSSDTLIKYFRTPYSTGGIVYREVNAETQGATGAAYVRFSFLKGYAGYVTNVNGSITRYTAGEVTVEGLENRVGDLESDVADLEVSNAELSADVQSLEDITTVTGTKTEEIENDVWTDGYITLGGTVNASTTYVYSEEINVNKDDVIRTSSQARFITAYYNGSAVVAKGIENTSEYTVPDGVDSIIITLKTANTKIITKTYTATENSLTGRVEALERIVNTNNKTISISAATLETGDTLEIGENIDTRKNDVIEFRGYITSFTSLTVGHGYMINHGRWFTIDNTNITLYRYDYDNQTAIQTSQQAHGLTFTHFIGVLINRGNDSNTFIEVNSDDGMYKWTGPDFHDASRGSITAFCVGTLTNVSLNALYRDFERDIFMFGDSYQTTGSENRYPYYLFANGFDKYLMVGFPGANSAHGYSALTAVLAKATPKFIIWCLGMNNSDSDNAINTDYKAILDNVISICENKGITLILTTIPNTPTRRHTYKNAYIKTLNYKYIDFAKAVGAESYPSTWYSGMLEENATPANRVHPTALGAKALYSQLITDFPEIMG